MTAGAHIRYAEARLALLLVFVCGEQRTGRLVLPPEGRGMGQALALGDAQLGAERWESADRCRIAWTGDHWTLSNHSMHMVCALNGCRIGTGAQAIMQIGDVLELDLMRFQLVEHEQARRQSDPFDALGLEGTRQPFRSDRFTASGSDQTGKEAEPLLALLNDEFLSVARDPTRLAGHADWIGSDLRCGEDAPTLDELTMQATPYPLLRDILLRRDAIDGIIGSFDDFGALDLAYQDVQPDVLRLFAPELSEQSSLRLPRLPGLTRREHHALSIDSAMRLGDVRPGDDKVPS